MATIETKHSKFTGHVGPVSFTEGKAETDLPTMVAHFKRDPERYEVTESKPRRRRGKAADKDKGKADDKAPEGDESGAESDADASEAPEATDEPTEGADSED